MESAGAQLKKIRLEKGLSLEDVHKKTKMHLKVLKALEDDNLVNVNPVYVRGFLKIYCKFLGVEPASLAPAAEYKAPAKSSRSLKAQTENISVKIKPATRLFKKEILSPYLNQKILVWVGAVIVFIFLLFVVGRIIGTRKNRQAVYAGSSLKKPVVFEPIKPRVSRITGEPVRQPVTSTIRLVMRARESCYIQLKTDGHLVFNSTLKKGKVETWVAKEKINFSLSNASAVSLELNGEPIPPLAKKKRMLKNVEITRDGHITIQ